MRYLSAHALPLFGLLFSAHYFSIHTHREPINVIPSTGTESAFMIF